MATRPALIPKPGKTRKLSWLYEDLAHQIILPHHLAAILILRYLAKGSNDAGRHYVSRATVCADCGGLSTNTFNRALKYLNNLGILSWKKGFGNQYSDANVASTYQLHLKAMQQLITEQGVFMASTRDYKPNLRLLSGGALTARVKLLPTINEQFATSDGESATSDDGFATSDCDSARSDSRSLTLYNLPSTGLPSVEDPLQEPPRQDSPARDNAQGGVQPLGGTPQCPPLRAIIAPSNNVPTRHEQMAARAHLPRGHRPEREEQYLDEAPC
jgi:hypothetical protein